MSETGVAEAPGARPLWRRHLEENPALALTVVYLFLTVVGAVYNWRLCSRFGVNILDLADGVDFLMFAVRDVTVVAWAVFPVALFAWVFALLRQAAATPVGERKGLVRLVGRVVRKEIDLRGTAAVCILASAIYIVYFLDQYAAVVARGIKSGHGRACEVLTAADAGALPRTAQLVTTTSRFFVLYLMDEKTTQVIPVDGLVRVVFRR
jgi:hypothetical protein